MPSYLGNYKNAAKDRDKKIIRAVNSVLNQSFQDWELCIVADGCQKTVDIIKLNYSDERIRLFYIPKRPTWSGEVRNEGIRKSTGEWICYLDIDDLFDTNHLQIIHDEIDSEVDWVWFNDFCFNQQTREFNEHGIILQKGKCGTSNICHKRSLNIRWPNSATYLHDWHVVNELKKNFAKYKKIKTPGYCICHVPNLLDV